LDLQEFISQYVVRFEELKPAPGAPPDAKLPRFNRERFMVLGRNSERPAGEAGPVVNTGINLAYARCEPGRGFCSHKHPDWEIFIALSGQWRITVADNPEVTIGPLDVVAVPGDVYHEALNIGDCVGCMMSINMGTDTARYTIHPDLVEELRRFAEAQQQQGGPQTTGTSDALGSPRP
jgi:mannose-6-phosphate isomerase-like protein (cupin superfamily)